MEQYSKYTFIHGPCLASLKSQEDRRLVRSQLVTRALRERNSPSTQRNNSNDLATSDSAEDIELLARARGRRILPSTAKSSNQTLCAGPCRLPGRSNGLQLSSAVSGGRKDPFGVCYPPSTVDRRCQELIDYCITAMWPGWRTLDDYPMQLYRSLIPLATSNPHVHYAFLLCASTHLASQSGRRAELQLEQLRYNSKALLSVRQVISSTTCFDVEALLTAMIFLAMNNDESLEASHDPNPFTPPFTDMQWLSHYARSELQPEHWKAIQIIVKKYGGVENLTVFAMPWLLTYASLIQSAISLSEPIYPLLHPDGQPYADISSTAFLGTVHQAPRANSGFGCLQAAGIPERLVMAFISLGQLSQALQMLNDGSVDRPAYDRIGDYRNLVQHRLLSLPTAEDLHEQALGDRTATQHIWSLYDTCRMTALLYSTHVTFPVPRTASQREDMLTSHRIKLLATGPHIIQSSQVLELLLWCTVIGGIASEHSTHRHWYTKEVKRLFTLCGVKSSLQLMETMKRFAWMEEACQGGARALWNAADGDARIMHQQ